MAFSPAAGLLGIFLGTFSYYMAALPTAGSLPHLFAPVAIVLGTMVLALVCVGLQLFFIYHISQAVSVNQETEAMIDEMMPRAQLRKGRSLGAPRVIGRHFWASSNLIQNLSSSEVNKELPSYDKANGSLL